jgi:hypothetical protein
MKKIKKGDRRKNPILSLYENENLKRGDSKTTTKKHHVPMQKRKKSKRETVKNTHLIPVWKWKSKGGGDRKKPQKNHDVPMQKLKKLKRGTDSRWSSCSAPPQKRKEKTSLPYHKEQSYAVHKNISSLYKIQNLKRGDRKKNITNVPI